MVTPAPFAPVDDSTVTNEVWRTRAAMARHAAADLRERMRLGLWMAHRHAAYTRVLLDEARTRLDLPAGGEITPAPDGPAGAPPPD